MSNKSWIISHWSMTDERKVKRFDFENTDFNETQRRLPLLQSIENIPFSISYKCKYIYLFLFAPFVLKNICSFALN